MLAISFVFQNLIECGHPALKFGVFVILCAHEVIKFGEGRMVAFI